MEHKYYSFNAHIDPATKNKADHIKRILTELNSGFEYYIARANWAGDENKLHTVRNVAWEL